MREGDGVHVVEVHFDELESADKAGNNKRMWWVERRRTTFADKCEGCFERKSMSAHKATVSHAADTADEYDVTYDRQRALSQFL